jgi:hypothetical protein
MGTFLFRPASAAIGFRDAGTGNNGGGDTSLIVNKPSTVAAGDVMIAIVSVRGGTGTTITPPTGWSFMNTTSSTTVIMSGAYYKYATGSEPSTYMFTFNATQKASGTISAYSGVDSIHYVDNITSSAYASSSTLTAPTVTTTLSNVMLVAGYSTATGTTMTAGSSMTLRGQDASTGGNANTRTTTGIQDIVQTSAGSSGTKNMTAGASAVNVGHLMALRPKLDMKMSAYRWFANANSTTPGSALAAQDAAASMGADTARLQMLTHIQDGITSPHHGVQLRYAARGVDNVCDASGTNETYTAFSSRAKTKATFGTTAANDTGTGTVAWSTPSGGLVPDFSNATAALTMANQTSNYLKITDLGFDIPTGATIHAVNVTTNAYPSYFSDDFDETSLLARVVKAGTIETSSSETQQLTTSTSGNYVRFAPSMYGASLTPSDVNNSGFGIAISAYGTVMTGNITVSISSVNVQVTYSDGGTMKTVDNATPVDGATPVDSGVTHSADGIVATAYSETDVANFTVGTTRQSSGDLLLDYALDFSGVSPGVYCFMAFREDGSALGATHDVVPQMTIVAPAVTQANYRWFDNADSASPGSVLASQDSAASRPIEAPFRLRQRLAVDTAQLGASATDYKLQYAEKVGTCDVGFTGETYADISVGGAPSSVSTYDTGNGTASGVGTSGDWVAESNLELDDNAPAHVEASLNIGETNQLRIEADPPALPAGAVVTGVRVGVDGFGTGTFEINGSLVLDGDLVGDPQAIGISGSEATTYTGSSSDMWGATFSAGDVNATSAMGVEITADAGDFDMYIEIDHIFLEVYYTLGSDIQYYVNASPSSGATITTSGNDPTNGARPTVYQTYNELNPFTNSVASIASGSDGIWDFALTSTPDALGKTYCLRVVEDDGDPLDTYSVIPEMSITAPGPTLDQMTRGGGGVLNGTKQNLTW